MTLHVLAAFCFLILINNNIKSRKKIDAIFNWLSAVFVWKINVATTAMEPTPRASTPGEEVLGRCVVFAFAETTNFVDTISFLLAWHHFLVIILYIVAAGVEDLIILPSQHLATSPSSAQRRFWPDHVIIGQAYPYFLTYER
jgi:hypothetical protein